MSTKDYKKMKKEELLNVILEKEDLISTLENRNEMITKNNKEAISEMENKLNKTAKIINEANKTNELLKRACEIHVSDKNQLKEELDKVTRDLETSNQLVENFKQQIDDDTTKIVELEESNKFYKNAYSKTLNSSKYLIACSIVFVLIAIVEAIIIKL